MSAANFTAAISDVEFNTSALIDMDQVTFFQDFLDALNTRIGQIDDVSPLFQKLNATRDRVLALQNEVNASGAGLEVSPAP